MEKHTSKTITLVDWQAYIDEIIHSGEIRKIGVYGHAALAVIISFSDHETGKATVPLKKIAELIGASEGMVSREINKMEEMGFLLISRKKWKTNTYQVLERVQYIPTSFAIFHEDTCLWLGEGSNTADAVGIFFQQVIDKTVDDYGNDTLSFLFEMGKAIEPLSELRIYICNVTEQKLDELCWIDNLNYSHLKEYLIDYGEDGYRIVTKQVS